jgi:malonyl-CoA decarboxylase
MLAHLRSDNFSDAFLSLVDQDPVHSLTEARSLERRCLSDRNIFFWLENDLPTAILCVAFTLGLTDDVDTILDHHSPVQDTADHAVFYSVFKTDQPSTQMNVGATLIREAAKWIHDNMPGISNFVTMSPIPNLSAHFTEPPSMDAILEFLQAQRDPVARFHIRNGATVLRIIPNADKSERRQQQSYSTMVNYNYTDLVLGGPKPLNN